MVINPTPVDPDLITLNLVDQQITFKKAIFAADAQVFTVKIKAEFIGLDVEGEFLTTSSSKTFEYKDPCKEATIVATPHETKTVQVY